LKFIAAILRFIRAIVIDKSILHEAIALPYSTRQFANGLGGPNMKIRIQSTAFPLTAAILDHTERRLRFALTPRRDRIRRVDVRLGDTNGPRGGEDKFCRIRVFLEDAPPVLIEDRGGNLYAAIGRAAERAGRNVVKGPYRLHASVRLARARPPASPSDEGVRCIP
jgi:ribosome-associated translation inhibitor RaiA